MYSENDAYTNTNNNNNIIIKEEFVKFGTYIYYSGFAFLVACFISYASVLQAIFWLIAIASIKKINTYIQDPDLKKFYSMVLVSTIFTIVSSIISIALVPVMLDSITTYNGSIQSNNVQMLTLINGLLVLLGAYVVSAVFGIIGWNSFIIFMENNTHKFPPDISRDGIEGAKKIKLAYIMMLLAFLFIPIILYFIFMIWGLFLVGDAFRKLNNYKIGEAGMRAPPYQPSSSFSSAPSPAPQSSEYGVPVSDVPLPPPTTLGSTSPTETTFQTPKFCPKCGAPLKPGMKFCPKCGSKVISSKRPI